MRSSVSVLWDICASGEGGGGEVLHNVLTLCGCRKWCVLVCVGVYGCAQIIECLTLCMLPVIAAFLLNRLVLMNMIIANP